MFSQLSHFDVIERWETLVSWYRPTRKIATAISSSLRSVSQHYDKGKRCNLFLLEVLNYNNSRKGLRKKQKINQLNFHYTRTPGYVYCAKDEKKNF